VIVASLPSGRTLGCRRLSSLSLPLTRSNAARLQLATKPASSGARTSPQPLRTPTGSRVRPPSRPRTLSSFSRDPPRPRRHQTTRPKVRDPKVTVPGTSLPRPPRFPLPLARTATISGAHLPPCRLPASAGRPDAPSLPPTPAAAPVPHSNGAPPPPRCTTPPQPPYPRRPLPSSPPRTRTASCSPVVDLPCCTLVLAGSTLSVRTRPDTPSLSPPPQYRRRRFAACFDSALVFPSSSDPDRSRELAMPDNPAD
jgi:hypothetical protein